MDTSPHLAWRGLWQSCLRKRFRGLGTMLAMVVFCWARSSTIDDIDQNSSKVITHSVKRHRAKQVLAQTRDYSISQTETRIRQETNPWTRADETWYKSLTVSKLNRHKTMIVLFLFIPQIPETLLSQGPALLESPLLPIAATIIRQKRPNLPLMQQILPIIAISGQFRLGNAI